LGRKKQLKIKMRYLILSPDYSQSCFQNLEGDYVDTEELNISKDLIKEINLWHEKYRKIIPLSIDERRKKKDEINILDNYGLNIIKNINKKNKHIKIRYFSEGFLKYIDCE
jgi:hypothetical protein